MPGLSRLFDRRWWYSGDDGERCVGLCVPTMWATKRDLHGKAETARRVRDSPDTQLCRVCAKKLEKFDTTPQDKEEKNEW